MTTLYTRVYLSWDEKIDKRILRQNIRNAVLTQRVEMKFRTV